MPRGAGLVVGSEGYSREWRSCQHSSVAAQRSTVWLRTIVHLHQRAGPLPFLLSPLTRSASGSSRTRRPRATLDRVRQRIRCITILSHSVRCSTPFVIMTHRIEHGSELSGELRERAHPLDVQGSRCAGAPVAQQSTQVSGNTGRLCNPPPRFLMHTVVSEFSGLSVRAGVF